MLEPLPVLHPRCLWLARGCTRTCSCAAGLLALPAQGAQPCFSFGPLSQDYEEWLEANAEGVAAFRASAAATLAAHGGRKFAAQQATVVDDLLVWLFRSKAALLLQREWAGVGALG